MSEADRTAANGAEIVR